MTRHDLFFLTTAATVLLLWGQDAGAGPARLGSAHRGPRDLQSQAKEDTGTTDDTSGTENESGPTQGEKSDDGSGLNEGGGNESNGKESGSEGSRNEGGRENGGSDLGGSSGTTDGAKAGSAGGTGGGIPSGSGPNTRKGSSGASAQHAFQSVAWYFEHNRERFVYRVAAARDKRLTTSWYSATALLGMLPRDTRTRTDVTAEDRAEISKLLKQQALSAKAVVRDAAVLRSFGGRM